MHSRKQDALVSNAIRAQISSANDAHHTFIDVSTLSIEDLESLVPTEAIPEDMNQPPIIYFGLHIAHGNTTDTAMYDLKKRPYIGTTSMDAQLSLIMANIAKVDENSIVYDPFLGTGKAASYTISMSTSDDYAGGILLMAAHRGSCCIGTDIDGRQMRGRNNVSIQTNLEHYNLQQSWIASMVMDIKHHAWRSGVPIFDVIICDPPYGVRAGAKVNFIRPSMSKRS